MSDLTLFIFIALVVLPAALGYFVLAKALWQMHRDRTDAEREAKAYRAMILRSKRKRELYVVGPGGSGGCGGGGGTDCEIVTLHHDGPRVA